MLEAGFWEVLGSPGLFYHDEWCVTLSCHGDDFIAEGESDDWDRLGALMLQAFQAKILPRIGPAEFGGQTTSGDHLHRVVRWSEHGFSWEADPKYSRQIVEELGGAGAARSTLLDGVWKGTQRPRGASGPSSSKDVQETCWRCAVPFTGSSDDSVCPSYQRSLLVWHVLPLSTSSS